MPSINIVHLGGYCEGEPRLVGDEGAIVSFRIRCHELVKPRGKESFVRTEYFTVKTFGQDAEWVGLNATDGTPLLVVGKLRNERWGEGAEKKRECVVIADWVRPALVKELEELQSMGKTQEAGAAVMKEQKPAVEQERTRQEPQSAAEDARPEPPVGEPDEMGTEGVAVYGAQGLGKPYEPQRIPW